MLPILSKNNWEGGVTVAVHFPELDSSSRDFLGTTCPSLSSKKEAASNSRNETRSCGKFLLLRQVTYGY